MDQAARNLGLPSRQLLEELYDLRQQVAQMNESIGDKEEQIKRQASNLQDFDVYKNDYKALKHRCDEVSVLLKQAEEDKGTLLDYVEVLLFSISVLLHAHELSCVCMTLHQDMRRHKQRDQAIIEEMTVSRDESKQRAAALDAKRAELENLLKEQLQILQASKQQCDVLETQLAKHRVRGAGLGQPDQICRIGDFHLKVHSIGDRTSSGPHPSTRALTLRGPTLRWLASVPWPKRHSRPTRGSRRCSRWSWRPCRTR